FVKTNAGYGVLVGTSVGLFATNQLNGTATVWVQQSPETIGNAICEMIKVRRVDNRVVVATHGGGVFAASITQGHHLTGIKEALKSTFTVFPNPATDAIIISASDIQTGGVYTIYNMLGKKVLETPATSIETRISISSLPSGTYIIKFKNGDTESSGKFVKK
ncbi:MAG TPA: T9SS type A sorting domain-containing protein, partial [Bacteroidia bacterium]|nr:T9SS type A sorting domain-containing protein [Bacteroidia bacterium]